MRSICIGLFKNSNNYYNKEYIKHILQQGNSLLEISSCEYKNNNLYEDILKDKEINAIFRSKFKNTSENVKIVFQEFDPCSFYEIVESIVNVSFNDVKELSDEPFDCSENAKKEIVGLIENILMKYQYQEPINLIYIIASIFKQILINHKLRNGNKRIASMILVDLLQFNGLFLKGSPKNKFKDFWKINEEQFIKFIEKYHTISKEHNFNELDNELLNEIYKWIYDRTYISVSSWHY